MRLFRLFLLFPLSDRTLGPLTIPSRGNFSLPPPLSLCDGTLGPLTIPSRGVLRLLCFFSYRDGTLSPLTIPSRGNFSLPPPLSLCDRTLGPLTIPSRGVLRLLCFFSYRDRTLSPLTIPSRERWWRRSEKSLGTRAANQLCTQYSGAGLGINIGPAPKTVREVPIIIIFAVWHTILIPL